MAGLTRTIGIAGVRFDLRLVRVDLRLRHPFTLSRGTKEIVPNVVAELAADGLIGRGEAGPNARYGESAEKAVQVLLEIADELEDPDFILPEVRRVSAHLGLDAQYSAATALETAWLDWTSRSEGMPLWRWLGLGGGTCAPSSFTIGLDTPEAMAAKIAERPHAACYKIKLGIGPDEDRRIIRTLRSITEAPLRVDANEGWTDPALAMDMIGFLAENGVELVEQPMPAAMHEAMIGLKARSPLPLYADESFSGAGVEELEQLSRGFHGVNIKLMKIGSVRKALDLSLRARRIGMKVMSGCMIESSLGIAAGALVGLDADVVDLDGHLLITNDPFDGLRTDEQGRIHLSDVLPGLQVDSPLI